jgi:hypothetical protein
MTATLATVLSLMSALIVAFSGHLLSERRKRRDELAEMRLGAYRDFINAASRLVAARRLGLTEDESEDLVALNDAKTRICICAEAQVVKALCEFWRHGGTLEREQEILAFTRLCMQIRESLGNKRHDLSNVGLSDTLFRLEPSSYSFRASRPTAEPQAG